MIKYLYSILLLISFSAWPAVKMELHFLEKEIQQGNIEAAKVVLEADGAQRIQLQKLKGQTLAETLYVYEVSPLIKREGGNGFEADAKVIFVKVPESKVIVHKMAQDELSVSFPEVAIKPTEAPQEFIYENFSIPSRPKIILWLSILLALVLGSWGGRKFYKKFKYKKELKEKRSKLKADLYAGNDYPSIVSIWQKREDFLKEFPHISDPFRKFETVLYKYQFKPTQSEVEKNLILDAYRSFLQEVMGGFNGV